ncbi:MAG TPA: hypothetical protein EYQ14_25880 [Gammaproteobacteria bacterium]|nr:hypothetical protein [Gammaproteobacteria bacterium]
MESSFHSLQAELVHREHYATRHQARSSLFESIEIYYNRQWRNSTMGNKILRQCEIRKTT